MGAGKYNNIISILYNFYWMIYENWMISKTFTLAIKLLDDHYQPDPDHYTQRASHNDTFSKKGLKNVSIGYLSMMHHQRAIDFQGKKKSIAFF